MRKETNKLPVVLVTNCGSSPIKFSVLNASDCEVLTSDIVDGINSENASSSVNEGEPVPLTHHSYEGALKAIAFELEKRNLNDNVALIGHRIAYGGSISTESVITTGEVIDNIRRASPLAPLYNYANLSGVESAQQLLPGVTQVAVFDISFHQTMAPEAYLYGLPWKYYEELGVRHHGFHGTSHHYVPQRVYFLLNLAEDDSGLAAVHLGNGASICTIRNGQSVDTSMGMTPLEGLMMGTRSGDIDFGAMSWIASQADQSLEDLERVANKESGLLGTSGLSPDLRALEKTQHKGHKHAQLTIETFVHRTARRIAGHAASLHCLNGTIFTGGIGGDSSLIRRLVVEHLVVLSVEIDTEMNNCSNSFGERIASSENARVICTVIPTNEEKMIALDAIHLGKANAFIEFAQFS